MKRVQKNKEQSDDSMLMWHRNRKRMRYAVFQTALGMGWLFLSGCMNLMAYYDMDTNLIGSSYQAADQLVTRLSPLSSPNPVVLAASFVNINHLEESSSFGKTVSEYIVSRLIRHGFKIKELKLGKSVFIRKQGGEFMLSRAIKEMSLEHHAGMVLVGTYSIAADVVYISARMLNPSDAVILAAYEYKLPLGNNNLKMLDLPHAKKNRRFPPGPLKNP